MQKGPQARMGWGNHEACGKRESGNLAQVPRPRIRDTGHKFPAYTCYPFGVEKNCPNFFRFAQDSNLGTLSCEPSVLPLHHGAPHNQINTPTQKFTHNNSFCAFCRLCFSKLKLLLLAIEVKNEEGTDSKIAINPKATKIQPNTQGFFIAQSADEVKR